MSVIYEIVVMKIDDGGLVERRVGDVADVIDD